MTEHVFPDGRRVQSCSDMVYTVEQAAALVEEIKAKTYDGVKARVLSLLEALLQAKGMGESPAGRVLDILLKDVDRLILDTATKHIPEITATLVDEKRAEREDSEAVTSLDALTERQHQLESSLGRVQDQIHARSIERSRKRLREAAGWIVDPAKIEEAVRVLHPERGDQSISTATAPGPFVAAIQRGKKAFDQIDAKEKK